MREPSFIRGKGKRSYLRDVIVKDIGIGFRGRILMTLTGI